ncbi:MAG: glycosyltransferase family 39 protein, partial [Prochlorothrix sp.]
MNPSEQPKNWQNPDRQHSDRSIWHGRTPTGLDPDRLWLMGLTLAALGLFLWNLGGVPLRDWDEGTVAQVAREIARSGLSGLLHPTIWGSPYLNKPPLAHGLIALSFQIFGVHTWSARLPGALLSATTIPLLYLLGRWLFPTPLPARFAALVYLTWLPVVRHGRLAMLDGTVVCFALILWISLLRSRHNPRWCLGLGLGFGGMVLTKGLLGVLLLGLALGFVLWDVPRLLRSPHLWTGLALGAAPALAWYGLQWQYYGSTFVEVSLLNQNLDRVWDSVENNAGPPGYYLLELLKYGWPWLLCLPWSLGRAWTQRHSSWAKLLLVWSGGYLLVISGMGTKLPWYIYPLYPALALMIGVTLAETWQGLGGLGGSPYSPRSVPLVWPWGWGLRGWGTIAAMVYFSPWGSEPDRGLLLACALVCGASWTAVILARRGNALCLPVLVWSWYLGLLLFVGSPHWVWELAEDYPVLPVAKLVRTHTPPHAQIYTSHAHDRPALNFYSDRHIQSRPWDTFANAWTSQTLPP